MSDPPRILLSGRWVDLSGRVEMKFEAKLDVDLVALEAEGEVSCLLSLEAPVPVAHDERPAETLVLVVDNSGSMSGSRIQAVQTALHTLVDRLKPQDKFGVVTFNSQARVHIPLRTMADHQLATVHALIDAVDAAGSTDLSAGLLMGWSEARRHLSETGASVLLLSDGHANQGIMDRDQLGELTSQARQDRLTTTTIGIGSGYDETLLSELATHGSGSHRFAFTDDDAISVVSEEAGDLLNKSIVNTVVRVSPTAADLISSISTFQSLPQWFETRPDGLPELVIPLGDLYSGEKRELLLKITLPALNEKRQYQLANIQIDYVSLPELLQQSTRWPIFVNVVPGEELVDQTPNPEVTTARLLAENTQAKKEEAETLHRGQAEQASRMMSDRASFLRAKLGELGDATDAELKKRILDEVEYAEKMARSALEQDPLLMRKSMMEDYSREVQGRNDFSRKERSRNKRDF